MIIQLAARDEGFYEDDRYSYLFLHSDSDGRMFYKDPLTGRKFVSRGWFRHDWTYIYSEVASVE
jgi:hypothetical protein